MRISKNVAKAIESELVYETPLQRAVRGNSKLAESVLVLDTLVYRLKMSWHESESEQCKTNCMVIMRMIATTAIRAMEYDGAPIRGAEQNPEPKDDDSESSDTKMPGLVCDDGQPSDSDESDSEQSNGPPGLVEAN